MTNLSADDIHPTASYYGHTDLTEQRAHGIQERDADVFKPYFWTGGNPEGRQWTREETNAAIADRRILMVELANALEAIAKLTPRLVERHTEADMLPPGTLVVEANGEIAVAYADKTGGRYFQSPGDDDTYAATRLSYPLKVVPLPLGAWIEEDEPAGGEG